MPAININMYIEMQPQALPRYIVNADSDVNAAILLPTTPYGTTPTNGNLTNPYYFGDGSHVLKGNNNYLYIPQGKQIDYRHVYIYDTGLKVWSPFDLTTEWFHDTTVSVTDTNGNVYSVVEFNRYDSEDEEYKEILVQFSFQLI